MIHQVHVLNAMTKIIEKVNKKQRKGKTSSAEDDAPLNKPKAVYQSISSTFVASITKTIKLEIPSPTFYELPELEENNATHTRKRLTIGHFTSS